MITELLGIFLITPVVAVLYAVVSAKFSASRPGTAERAVPQPAKPSRLEIVGTHRAPQPWLTPGLLRSFDLPPDRVQDVVWYTLARATPLPAAVSGCLASTYMRGYARGVDVMKLAAHGKAKPGRHLVFALVTTGTNEQPDIFAMVV